MLSANSDADVRRSLVSAAKKTEAFRIAQTENRGSGVTAQAEGEPVPAGATIISPATGTDVAGDFQLTVSRGSAVYLSVWVDGTQAQVDGGSDETVVFDLNLTGPAEGQSHTIEVGNCPTGYCIPGQDGEVTDSITVTAYPALGVDVTSASSSGYFSPNGDGTKDSVTVKYTTQGTGNVTVAVSRVSDGAVVRKVTVGSKAAGSFSYVWNGKDDAGSVVANGAYRVAVSLATSGGSTSSDGVTVVLDTTKPSLTNLKRSDSKVFPRKDKYRDWVTFSAKLSEKASVVKLTITNSKGKTVRTLSTKSVLGTVKLKWNGRTSSGKLLPKGTYKYKWTATDLAGNAKSSSAGSIVVDNRILKLKVKTKTITPSKARVLHGAGDCSLVKVNPNGWSGARGYWSMWKPLTGRSCYDETYTDLVFGEYKYTVPKAVKYGTVRVGALGKAHPITYQGRTYKNSVAGMSLLRNDSDDALASTKTLGSSYKTRWTGSRSFSSLDFGRTVRWLAATNNYNWYDVRSFKVKWSYYVLVD